MSLAACFQVGRDVPTLSALLEEANNQLRGLRLEGKEEVMQLHGELEWLSEAQKAAKISPRASLEDVESLLADEP